MTKDEALDKALEAAYLAGFNASGEGYNGEYPFRDHGAHPEQDAGWIKNRDSELNAIKQARSAPVQEPCGRLESDPDEGHIFVPRIEGDWSMLGEDLYTTPPAAQRQWVGLTDAEVMQTMSGDWTSQFYFARAIEAKLKEKNT